MIRLNKKNLTCRLGDVVVIRNGGVESGDRHIWMRTALPPQESNPSDPATMVVPVDSKLTRLLGDGTVDVYQITKGVLVEGEDFSVDLPPAVDHQVSDLMLEMTKPIRTWITMGVADLERILKAAKAAKSSLVQFGVPESELEGVRFQLPMVAAGIIGPVVAT